MKPSAEALNAALIDFKTLSFSTQKVSLYESLLVAGWLQAHGRYPDPVINDANEAVAALFEVLPDNEMGRLQPCRYDGLVAEVSGRKTVWNNTTRSPKLAKSIFTGDDIRKGLKPNATDITQAALADEIEHAAATGVGLEGLSGLGDAMLDELLPDEADTSTSCDD